MRPITLSDGEFSAIQDAILTQRTADYKTARRMWNRGSQAAIIETVTRRSAMLAALAVELNRRFYIPTATPMEN